MLRNLLIACTFTLLAMPSFAQAQGSRCEELRLACEQKQELGEVGQGNCRRYREECGNDREEEHLSCQELRYKCLHKYELGEQGEGNCRRYREQCRSY